MMSSSPGANVPGDSKDSALVPCAQSLETRNSSLGLWKNVERND